MPGLEEKGEREGVGFRKREREQEPEREQEMKGFCELISGSV